MKSREDCGSAGAPLTDCLRHLVTADRDGRREVRNDTSEAGFGPQVTTPGDVCAFQIDVDLRSPRNREIATREEGRHGLVPPSQSAADP